MEIAADEGLPLLGELLAQRERATLEKPQQDDYNSGQATVPKRSARSRQGVGETLAKSVARALGSSLGRAITRGILGSITGRR